MSLGQNIKRLRLAAGISTQRALADRLHVPQPQVSDWENDRYGTLETQTLMKLAKVLRCTIDQLLDGVDPDYDQVREAREAVDVEPARIDYGTDSAGSIPLVAEGSAAPAGTPWRDDAPPPGEIRAMDTASPRRGRRERLRGPHPRRLDGARVPPAHDRDRHPRPAACRTATRPTCSSLRTSG